MSEEEKKAIKSLRIKATYIGDNYNFGVQGIKDLRNELNIILNLTEKQNKKIEELEKENLDKSEAVFRFSQRHFNDIEKIKRLAELEERIKKGEIVEIGDSIPKSIIREEIEKLERDAEKIREKKKDANDYDRSKARMQAYLTKTNEIKKRLEELLGDEQ